MKITLHPGDSIVQPPGSVIAFSNDCGSAEIIDLGHGNNKITANLRKDGEVGFSWECFGPGGGA